MRLDSAGFSCDVITKTQRHKGLAAHRKWTLDIKLARPLCLCVFVITFLFNEAPNLPFPNPRI
jgi:hypothetical protein